MYPIFTDEGLDQHQAAILEMAWRITVDRLNVLGGEPAKCIQKIKFSFNPAAESGQQNCGMPLIDPYFREITRHIVFFNLIEGEAKGIKSSEVATIIRGIADE
jgi:hypothetical protein